MPTAKYTIRTMPEPVFNKWMTLLRNFPHKQIYRNLHNSQGDCCAWGVYIQSTYGPKTEYAYNLITDTIVDNLYQYVVELNDKEYMPFTEIADKLEANRTRAVRAYTTRQHAAIYEDLCNS